MKENGEGIIYGGVELRPGIKLVMEKDTFIGNNCSILVPYLEMKRGSQICANTVVAGRKEVFLYENVVVGYQCTLLTSSDRVAPKMNDASLESERNIVEGQIILMPNVYVGSQTLIMPGVTIAEGVVVRAKSYIDETLDRKYRVYADKKVVGRRPIFWENHLKKK